jgi:hypothetical protein
LLKLKSFRVLSCFYSDKDVHTEGFLDTCAETFKQMGEFIEMLNDVCMPDDDSSDEDEEGEDDDNDEVEDTE